MLELIQGPVARLELVTPPKLLFVGSDVALKPVTEPVALLPEFDDAAECPHRDLALATW